MKMHKRIYTGILELLDSREMSRENLIKSCVNLIANRMKTPPSEDDLSELRGDVGATINELEQNGIILFDGNRYKLISSKPVALRSEGCEKALLDVLQKGPMTKLEIRSYLEEFFGTNKTATVRDDNMLYSMIGQILRRLVTLGLIVQNGANYEIAPKKAAKIDDINKVLSLKNEFLVRLHAKGGEFFENYFMTLLGKYLTKNGKTVVENRTTGGSADGGIDGIIKTVDVLGFRETLMVQTKNRTELTSETVVRGFYGAVCAANGSRGIFATTSDFHPSARKLLDYIDNCVGVNGDKIFSMAAECQYGLKKKSSEYIIDDKML